MKRLKAIIVFVIITMVVQACNPKNKAAKNTADVHQKHTYYTCSMDPQVKADKPGKCPICHMELTPIKQDDTALNQISLSNQQIVLGNISTQNISDTQRSLQHNYTGVLTINQETINVISSRAMGRIEKLFFKEIGDYVNKNQPVYQLYSEELAIAKQDYFTAFEQLAMPGDFGKNAHNLLEASRQKLLFFGLTNSQIEKLKTHKDVSPYTIFYSTVSGTISEISTTEGSYVMEGASIIKLADLNNLWLETQINVNFVKQIKIGQNAQITFPDFPGKTITTQISFINPEINLDTRLLLIRFKIPNLNLELKPGMQAVATVIQPNLKGTFVPVNAVIRGEKNAHIWVEKSPGLFESVRVDIGIESAGMIEIKSPLDATLKVVVTGAYALNSEYKFRKGSDPMGI